jgi:hypothetical protein
MSKKKEKMPNREIMWPVILQHLNSEIRGTTTTITPNGVYVRCLEPLKLNEICDMTIATPDHDIKAKVEVVWSNIHGPDDNITPRGMGVRFLVISGEDRSYISRAVDDQSLSDAADQYLQSLSMTASQID